MAVLSILEEASSSSSHRWKYDVFLSFRGVDTRKGFISHLYHELQYWHAIRTFKDDREIEAGATISQQLLHAIEESHLAVVVLSPNYASSTWCLDELAEIVQSRNCENTILPVFFDVDPSDVRHQIGSFSEAFVKHEKRIHDKNKVQRWRDALRKVASISGVSSNDYPSERDVIKAIVEFVCSKVIPLITLSNSNDNLVGVDKALIAMSGLLDLEVEDVRFIGIWGMGGVGKTTLAKLVFQRISHQFEVTKFLFNGGEISAKHNTVVDLQKQLISPFLKGVTQVWDEEQGAAYIRKYLFNKKVLLVIDNVDHYSQLEMLIGNISWFGDGSRIIVTTRDERLLIQHDIEISYRVGVLNDQKALELFSHNAFKQDQPKDEFFQLSKAFVDYAKGLPLALKIVGRSLYKRDLNSWNSELDKLKMNPNPTIFDSLKLSYDVLDDMQKTIFLDIAHFYKGMKKGQVIETLESCGLCGCIGLAVLIEKSLIEEHSNYVGMHDLIQEMAVEIVRRECIKDPGRRSRLCNKNDVFGVLKNNTGTKAVRGIQLRLPCLEEGDMDWNIEGLTKMSELVFLEFYNLRFRSAPQFLPGSLRTLKWSWYPSKYLPASFRPNLLVELRMANSKIVQLWHGKQDFPSLKYMNLVGSRNLIKTPDFTGIPNLEKLELAFCWNLCEIHPSLTVLKKLKRLNLLNCKNIKRFPTVIDMESLEIFWFRESTNACIPDIGRGMKNLLSLDLGCTIFEKRTSYLESVGFWNLFTKKSLVCQGSLFQSLRELRFLKKLRLDGCKLWEGALPDDIGYCMPNLVFLFLSGNDFVTLPASIKCMSKLEMIDLNDCKSLQQLMDLPPIAQLEVQVNNCPSLKMFSKELRIMGLDCRPHDTISMLHLTSVNCFGLVDDEGWNQELFLMVKQFAAQVPSPSRIIPDFGLLSIISPGSKIPAWFNIQSEGNTLTVKLPAHQESCRPKCIGIWFCVVFANPDPSVDPDYALEVAASKEKFSFSRTVAWDVKGDHMWMLYLFRLQNEETTNISVTIKDEFLSLKIGLQDTSRLNSVNRCAARLMFEDDMNQLLYVSEHLQAES